MLDKFDYISSVILWPLLLVGFGLFLILQVFHDTIPNKNQFIEVNGVLSEYQFEQTGRGKSDYHVLISLRDYNALFIDSFLDKEQANQKLKKGIDVKFHIAKTDSSLLNNIEEIPTWSTTIDREVLQPLDTELKQQNGFKYYILPIMGVIMVIFGFIIHVREKKKLTPRIAKKS